MALQGTGSLIVPSVQELVKQPITKIPERYIHSNKNPVVESNTDSLPQVPVIDLSKLLSDDATELEKLDQSCREWGFFQVYFIWLILVIHIYFVVVVYSIYYS
jgi:hypothetical protein